MKNYLVQVGHKTLKTVSEVELLEEINRDHSEDWTDYTAEDDLFEAVEYWTEWELVKELK